jgi:hypothetical protein
MWGVGVRRVVRDVAHGVDANSLSCIALRYTLPKHPETQRLIYSRRIVSDVTRIGRINSTELLRFLRDDGGCLSSANSLNVAQENSPASMPIGRRGIALREK